MTEKGTLSGWRKDKILANYNYQCVYCGNPASEIDHILPRAYKLDNSNDNLVAACTWCNLIARDLVFDSLQAKKDFILNERQKTKWKRRMPSHLWLPDQEVSTKKQINYYQPAIEIDLAERKEIIQKPDKAKEIVLETQVTPQMIFSLRAELGQSQSEFGWTLKRAANPKAERPYSRQYIDRLEKGKDRMTPKLVAAFFEIASVMDEVPHGVGGAVTVRVLAQPGQVIEGALIKRTMQTKACARPGCKVVFIGLGKYHDPECAREWRNTRRRQAHRA